MLLRVPKGLINVLMPKRFKNALKSADFSQHLKYLNLANTQMERRASLLEKEAKLIVRNRPR